MKTLDDRTLTEVSGGISATSIIGGIAVAIAFFASVIYGFFFSKEG